MQTRRGFLKLLGVAVVAGPALLRAAVKSNPAPVSLPVVQLSTGSGVLWNPADHTGEIVWKNVRDNWDSQENLPPYSLIVSPDFKRELMAAIERDR